jgi:hypothetical protein
MCSVKFRSRQHFKKPNESYDRRSNRSSRRTFSQKNREKLLAAELALDHRTHPYRNAEERGLFEQRIHSW